MPTFDSTKNTESTGGQKTSLPKENVENAGLRKPPSSFSLNNAETVKAVTLAFCSIQLCYQHCSIQLSTFRYVLGTRATFS